MRVGTGAADARQKLWHAEDHLSLQRLRIETLVFRDIKIHIGYLVIYDVQWREALPSTFVMRSIVRSNVCICSIVKLIVKNCCWISLATRELTFSRNFFGSIGHPPTSTSTGTMSLILSTLGKAPNLSMRNCTSSSCPGVKLLRWPGRQPVTAQAPIATSFFERWRISFTLASCSAKQSRLPRKLYRTRQRCFSISEPAHSENRISLPVLPMVVHHFRHHDRVILATGKREPPDFDFLRSSAIGICAHFTTFPPSSQTSCVV